jgi:hypothetical protein
MEEIVGQRVVLIEIHLDVATRGVLGFFLRETMNE